MDDLEDHYLDWDHLRRRCVVSFFPFFFFFLSFFHSLFYIITIPSPSTSMTTSSIIKIKVKVEGPFVQTEKPKQDHLSFRLSFHFHHFLHQDQRSMSRSMSRSEPGPMSQSLPFLPSFPSALSFPSSDEKQKRRGGKEWTERMMKTGLAVSDLFAPSHLSITSLISLKVRPLSLHQIYHSDWN
jgi:hypothetical protein